MRTIFFLNYVKYPLSKFIHRITHWAGGDASATVFNIHGIITGTTGIIFKKFSVAHLLLMIAHTSALDFLGTH